MDQAAGADNTRRKNMEDLESSSGHESGQPAKATDPAARKRETIAQILFYQDQIAALKAEYESESTSSERERDRISAANQNQASAKKMKTTPTQPLSKITTTHDTNEPKNCSVCNERCVDGQCPKEAFMANLETRCDQYQAARDLGEHWTPPTETPSPPCIPDNTTIVDLTQDSSEDEDGYITIPAVICFTSPTAHKGSTTMMQETQEKEDKKQPATTNMRHHAHTTVLQTSSQHTTTSTITYQPLYQQQQHNTSSQQLQITPKQQNKLQDEGNQNTILPMYNTIRDAMERKHQKQQSQQQQETATLQPRTAERRRNELIMERIEDVNH
jgi:hypothetical protein